MSRDPPQRRGAARETALRLTARRPLIFDGVPGAQATARQGDASGTEAVSLPLTLRQGWKPAAPEGPGRDGAAGSVRSMTARPDARCRT